MEAPVVIGNPEGNLPHATLEGYVVATALGSRARHLGAYTTTAADHKDTLLALSVTFRSKAPVLAEMTAFLRRAAES